MYYVSTRDKNKKLTAAQSIARGLAADGGLMTPERFPRLEEGMLEKLTGMTYQQRAVEVMKLFLEDFSEEELAGFSAGAYGGGKFSDERIAPVRPVDGNTHCLELWHGPTCAFKDMALQMLPRLLSASLVKTGEKRTACILAATSGDTGSAALAGFKDVDQTRILVFYPQNGVSKAQQLQMTTQEGGNVGVCAVMGNFDDAQTGVKKMFSDEELRGKLDEKGFFFSSANSINWGRILPQVVYYVSACCDLLQSGALKAGEKVNFCVPTGNFGNILAGYYAKKMGAPIGRLICASNSNNVLTDFLTTGVYDRNRPFYQTTSPSMDILISSNLERMLFELSGENDEEVRGYMAQLSETGRYEVSETIRAGIDKYFAAGCCDDAGAAAMMGAMWKENGYLIDPHTAVAFDVLRQYREKTGDQSLAVVASTASPYKFCDSVLAAIGAQGEVEGLEGFARLSELTGTEIPAPLAALAGKQVRFDGCVAKERMPEQVMGMLW